MRIRIIKKAPKHRRATGDSREPDSVQFPEPLARDGCPPAILVYTL